MKKYRLNQEKLLRNVGILAGIISASIFVYKVWTCGIAWISTIGYLG
jgi:hypothetical protein